MFSDDFEETIFAIKDVVAFKEYIRTQVWKKFQGKIHNFFDEESASLLQKQNIDVPDIPVDILDYEIDRFILIDDNDDNKGIILKRDIKRLITSLTNEVISYHLNKMVDAGIMEMCWDSERYEFIWRPKLKE